MLTDRPNVIEERLRLIIDTIPTIGLAQIA